MFSVAARGEAARRNRKEIRGAASPPRDPTMCKRSTEYSMTRLTQSAFCFQLLRSESAKTENRDDQIPCCRRLKSHLKNDCLGIPEPCADVLIMRQASLAG